MSILALTSDTLIATAAAGNLEYSSPIFTGTPVGTQRGIVPTQQYYRLESAYVGSNVNTAQSIFGVGCTLSASTVYAFEAVIALSKTAGTTSHQVSIGFGGTATINNIGYSAVSNRSDISFTDYQATIAFVAHNTFVQTLAATPVTTTGLTNATETLVVNLYGTVSINAGGTFIPQYTLSAAPGGAYSTAAGSYIRIAPISASGAATNVGTWA
jgi:hypothetical protein